MDIQRLRNLTTGRLHTKMEHIYEDIEFLTSSPGVMTHQLPNALRALISWLKVKVHDPRFWDGAHDTSHTGEFNIEPMEDGERTTFFDRFAALPSPLAGTNAIAVLV